MGREEINSAVLDASVIVQIARFFPSRYQEYDLQLLLSTKHHGPCLQSFSSKAMGMSSAVLAVAYSAGNSFWLFCIVAIAVRQERDESRRN